MHVIVGLGNPGTQYQHTRHNIGFLFVEHLASQWKIQFKLENRFRAEVARHNDILLVKPQTFMNESGQSVKAITSFYKQDFPANTVPKGTLFVAFDDLDIPLGTQKLQFAKGPKVHNGLSSIYDHLKTEQFYHLRLGIENRGDKRAVWPGREYVLSAFRSEEEQLLQEELGAAKAQLLPLLKVQ